MTINGHANRITVQDQPPHYQEIPLPTFSGDNASRLQTLVTTQPDWVVQNVFASGQPTVFGAAAKAGKTTQLCDLAVALATGTNWLSAFHTPRKRKVLFITGESSRRGIAKRIDKAIKAPWRNHVWQDLSGWLHVEAINFPLLPSIEDRMGIQNDIRKHGFEVVILDPIYRGLGDLDSHRFAQIAGAIVEFTKACQPADLIMSHHNTKSASREMRPPTLEDLNGAGFGQACGNWWLLGRNQHYQFDGIHDLSVTFGGRDEQAGRKRIVFNESDWTFEITSGQDLKDQKARERENKKQETEAEKLRIAKADVRHALANQKQYRPKTWVEARSKSTQRFTRMAIAELLDAGELIEGEYLDSAAKKKKGGLGLKSSASLVSLSLVKS